MVLSLPLPSSFFELPKDDRMTAKCQEFAYLMYLLYRTARAFIILIHLFFECGAILQKIKNSLLKNEA